MLWTSGRVKHSALLSLRANSIPTEGGHAIRSTRLPTAPSWRQGIPRSRGFQPRRERGRRTSDDGGGATLHSGTHCLTLVDRLRDAPSPVVATRPERWCTGDRDEHLLRPHRRQRGRLDRLGRGRARRPHDGLHALSRRDGARRLRRSQSGIFAPRLSGRPVEKAARGANFSAKASGAWSRRSITRTLIQHRLLIPAPSPPAAPAPPAPRAA